MKETKIENFVAVYFGNYKVDLGSPAANNIDFASNTQRNSCLAFQCLGFKVE